MTGPEKDQDTQTEVHNNMSKSHVEDSKDGSRERRKILIVGKEDTFTQDVVNYAVHLAERLDYEILALSVDTKGRGELFMKRAAESVKKLKRSASRLGIECEHAVKSGELGTAVEELNHEVKRIEFVVTDAGVCREEVTREVTVPMFSVISNSLNAKGGKTMAGEQVIQKRKPVGSTIGYGLVTAAMYAAVFTNADTVMNYFTRGGWYAALPIVTVFAFSFAHGAFAHNLWSLLGVEAAKKESLRETERKVVQKRKQAAKRPRAYAYVNPFHRID